MAVIIMVSIIALLLLGKSEADAAIKPSGRLLIPSADGGQKAYKAVLMIKRSLIRIECDKKIFQPFNEFDAPKQNRLDINTSELMSIKIDAKEKKIYIIVEISSVSRYRNILNLETRYLGYSCLSGHAYKEFWAIIFVYDKLDMDYLDQEVLNLINNRAGIVYTKHFFYEYN
jgi:hypothetical protein